MEQDRKSRNPGGLFAINRIYVRLRGALCLFVPTSRRVLYAATLGQVPENVMKGNYGILTR